MIGLKTNQRRLITICPHHYLVKTYTDNPEGRFSTEVVLNGWELLYHGEDKHIDLEPCKNCVDRMDFKLKNEVMWGYMLRGFSWDQAWDMSRAAQFPMNVDWYATTIQIVGKDKEE